VGLLRLLIDRGADVNKCDAFGDPSLELVARMDIEEIFELLVSKDAYVGTNSQLVRVANAGNFIICELQRKKWTEVAQINGHGLSPLEPATWNGHLVV
jgi:ankyrin repeat protein